MDQLFCLPAESKFDTLSLTKLPNCVDRFCCGEPASIVAIDCIPALIHYSAIGPANFKVALTADFSP